MCIPTKIIEFQNPKNTKKIIDTVYFHERSMPGNMEFENFIKIFDDLNNHSILKFLKMNTKTEWKNYFSGWKECKQVFKEAASQTLKKKKEIDVDRFLCFNKTENFFNKSEKKQQEHRKVWSHFMNENLPVWEMFHKKFHFCTCDNKY